MKIVPKEIHCECYFCSKERIFKTWKLNLNKYDSFVLEWECKGCGKSSEVSIECVYELSEGPLTVTEFQQVF